MKLNLKNTYNILTKNWEENLSLLEIFSAEKNILFFYPRDNTPGCTVENKDFTCLKSEFDKLWVKLVWVSKDSMESHWKFVAKHALENDLISDVELNLHKELWAYWEKNNYWKIIMWVIRSTFLISKDWEVLKEWRNIRAKWHAERILEELK
jgi:peroxiredoxin Q/BCP